MQKFLIDQETFIGSVALKVRDMEKQLAFYTDVLKLDILNEENDMAFLGIKGRKAPLIALLEEPGALPSPYTHNGLNHIGFKVKTRQQLSEFLNHLEAVNYPVLETLDYGYAEVLVIKDPEYNVIKIYWDKEIKTEKFTQENRPLDVEDLRRVSSDKLEQLSVKTVVGHVQLNVSDIEKSEAFYKEVLGLRLRETDFRSVRYLSGNDYHHHISLRHSQILEVDKPDDEHMGLDYVTFYLRNEEALEALKMHLDDMKMDYFYNKGKRILNVDDPDGMHIWFRVIEMTV
ncbi:VOC family protein [Vagococcus xieshaowenii]|nr:VOC family protein [Vagococcus xieshaowenii]